MAYKDKETQRIATRAYRLAHKAAIKAGRKKWASENPEWRRAYNAAYYIANKEKFNTSARAWRVANRDKVHRDKKKYHLQRAYNLTPEAYAELAAAQGGVCAICKCDPSESAHGVLAVDHSHGTGEVRGLLCSGCNIRVGHYESPWRVATCAYLVKHA